MSRHYVCTDGHRFTAIRPPERCPYAPKGKPCEAEVQPATKARSKAK